MFAHHSQSSPRNRVGVQSAMAEMERLEAKGDASQEEIEALAQELSSKMLLTTWRATRWEVINVSLFLCGLDARPPVYAMANGDSFRCLTW